MSYYKITYESNTIEGLKAIQSSFSGHEASVTDSSASQTPAPPPPQQDMENLNASSGVVQAPPTADEAGAGSDLSDRNAFYPPPPNVADAAAMDGGSEEEIPPPPGSESQGQEGKEAQTDDGTVPPP